MTSTGEHLYILSNPSVPGVIKVGKTTSSLDQKLSELHLADDPIPLILEFYAEVENCEKSENSAHQVLSEFRISPELKFFRISLDKALETITPVIGKFTAVDVSEANKPLTPEEIHERRMMLAERKEAERVSKIILKDKAEREARKARKREIEAAITQERKNIRRLGHRPVKQFLPMFWFCCLFCFSPRPVGWLVWLGALGVFYAGTFYLGCICIGLVLLGYFAHHVDVVNDETYREAMVPFNPIDDRIRALQIELKEVKDKLF